jgi:NADH:ubiquinone oxidoreductase subunit H
MEVKYKWFYVNKSGSANSKYAFLGSLRSTAQLISYELVLTSAILLVVMLTSNFNLSIDIEAQRAVWFIFPLFPILLIFFIGSVAETNRAPFDLAEAESELVSGFMTEHAAVIFVFFFLAEYGSILLMCILTSVLFGGGYLNLTFIDIDLENFISVIETFNWNFYSNDWWLNFEWFKAKKQIHEILNGGSGAILLDWVFFYAWIIYLILIIIISIVNNTLLTMLDIIILILEEIYNVESLEMSFSHINSSDSQHFDGLAIEGLFYGLIIGLKSALMVFIFIWVRAAFPRIRFDQLMSFCWTVLLPLVFAFIILIPCILYTFNVFIVNVNVF